MRLRVTRRTKDCVDGISLDQLRVGLVYEVGTTIGCYLLALGLAEPAEDDVPALAPPWGRISFATWHWSDDADAQMDQPQVEPRTEAADRPSRPKRRRKR